MPRRFALDYSRNLFESHVHMNDGDKSIPAKISTLLLLELLLLSSARSTLAPSHPIASAEVCIARLHHSDLLRVSIFEFRLSLRFPKPGPLLRRRIHSSPDFQHH